MRFAAAISFACLAGACVKMDDSPSMRAELRAAKAELNEATRELRAATKELVDARAALDSRAKPAEVRLAVSDRIPGLGLVKCASALRCSMPRSVLQNIDRARDKLARQATLRPVRSKGKVIGYRLESVPANSLTEKLGLEAGDIIERVQTTSLTGKGDVDAIMKKVSAAKRITALVKRNKKRLTLRIDITD